MLEIQAHEYTIGQTGSYLYSVIDLYLACQGQLHHNARIVQSSFVESTLFKIEHHREKNLKNCDKIFLWSILLEGNSTAKVEVA